MSNKRLTEEERNLIKHLFEKEGLAATHIAKYIGCSPSTVSKVLGYTGPDNAQPIIDLDRWILCPTCRHRVHPPCLACSLKKEKKRSTTIQTKEKLVLCLNPAEDSRRKELLREKRKRGECCESDELLRYS